MDFTHLHVHTSYSPLEGADRIESLVKAAEGMGLSAMAITDTNGLYGALTFYREATGCGIRPIIGVEIKEDKNPHPRTFEGENDLPSMPDRAILLARNFDGYRHLCRIVTERHLSDRFDLVDSLGRWGKDLFVLVSSPSLMERVNECMERGFLFCELISYGRPGERKRIEEILSRAKRLGVHPVATNDVHFIEPGEYRIHRVLSAIRTRSTVATVPGKALAHPQAWLKPPSMMKILFKEIPEATKNTVLIAEGCELDLELGKVKFPPFPIPDGDTPLSFLSRIAHEGLRKRYRPITRRAIDQLQYELRIIEDLSFTTYFLIVWDICRYARQKGIPVVGRGSAANSIVCYALGITHVDPIKHNLYFERFLNPERKDCPDIDLDFPWNRRNEVIKYIYETYGEDRVAMISTHICFRGRSIVREVGKALGIPVSEIDTFTRRIPYLTQLSELEQAREMIPEVRDLPIEDEPFRTILKIGRRIEGHLRHLSIHCGGIVVAPGPISEFIPLQRADKGIVVTQFDMYPVEDMGLVKIDILGQRSLAVIVDTKEAVRRNYGIDVDFDKIDPQKDEKTRRLIREGKTMGCFYIESPGMRNLLKKLKVEDFDLLVAASSIIRPGVADSGMMKAFVDRHNGREPVRYLHPMMESLLKDTYGIMIYQEDVIKVAHHIAGMSLGEADALRRCMSKKRNWEAMENYRERFLKGAIENGVREDAAIEIWRQVESFGGYAFCKAHSASFAQISYQSAFLKAHFPAEFMSAVISNQGGFYTTSAYLEEARRMGLRILPPDVNVSEYPYTAEPATPGVSGAIRVGLIQVKGLSKRSIQAICSGRRDGPYRSLPDLLRRTGIDLREAEALIRCGALDSWGKRRPILLWELELIRKGLERNTKTMWKKDLYTPLPLSLDPISDLNFPQVSDYSQEEKIIAEMEAMGLAITDHPLTLFQEEIKRDKGIVEAREIDHYVGKRVRLVGWFVTSKRTRTKNGEFMKFLTLEDRTASFEVTLFPQVYNKYGHILQGSGPFMVTGKVEEDSGAITINAERLEALKTSHLLEKSPFLC